MQVLHFSVTQNDISSDAMMVTEIKDTNKRSDYVEVHEHCTYSWISCYGKVRDDISTNIDCVMDFYRLCLFAKGGIEEQKLNRVIFFKLLVRMKVEKRTRWLIDICFSCKHRRESKVFMPWFVPAPLSDVLLSRLPSPSLPYKNICCNSCRS